MLIVRVLLGLVLVLGNCWAGHPIFDTVDPQLIQDIPSGYRLPEEIRPSQYDIKLKTHFNVANKKDNFTFDGQSTIVITTTKKINTIRFHAKELEFDKAKSKIEYVHSVNNTNKIVTIDVTKHDIDKEKDFMTLTLKEDLVPKRTYSLILHYTGKLNDELRGFYRSSYQDAHNNTIWLATTHFEPVGARRAFPCWDEPAIKAEFIISIQHFKNYHALSNMPGSKGQEDGDKIWTNFKKTPKMSTYLVAFVVSDYESVSNKENTFNVWTKSDAIANAKYSFDIGQLILAQLEEFTNIKYKDQQMEKMDQITIPNLLPGAMENWGLVTYRENALLYKENVTTTQKKQSIASLISHEFAHQWFGNLVSPEWWKYIWLNEGFATFLKFYITDQVISKQKNEASWRLTEQFVVKDMQGVAFVTDVGPRTRPMNQDAATPSQIKGLFGSIAYTKAACIIRMMQNFLTEDVFRDGLRKYLNDYKFKSANSDDLFNTINKVVSKNDLPKSKELKVIMHEWVNKAGYPVVTVKRDEKSGEATVTQEQFFLSNSTKSDGTSWWIPLTYITEDSDKIKKSWLEPYKSAKIGGLNASVAVLFNTNQTGYYRVNYDNTNWERLIRILNSDKYGMINPINRAQLIDDALNLAIAGRLSYKIALKVTTYLSKEVDYIPWYAAIRSFNYLNRVLQGTKNYAVFHKYVAQKLQPFVNAVKFEQSPNETHVTKLARELMLTAACNYELNDCKVFVQQKFDKWLKDNVQLSPDLKNAIPCAALRNADEKLWNAALGKYMSSEDKTEKAAILSGLGCVKSKKIIKKFLALTLAENATIGIFDAINSINTGNPTSFDILIDFIQANIEKIKAVDKTKKLLTNHLNQLSNKITTIEQYGKLVLLAHRELPEFASFEGLNNGRLNLDWIEAYKEEVVTWIIENYLESKKEGKKPNTANSVTLTSFLVIIPVLLARLY